MTDTEKSNLRQLRENLNITQTDLVMNARMGMGTISMIENDGYYPPKEDTRERLLVALNKFSDKEITESDVWPWLKQPE